MELELLVPEVRPTTLAEVVAMARADAGLAAPFSADTLEFCSAFSQAIFRDRDAARFPELAALAFWMRKAELVRLRAEVEAGTPPQTIPMPRGLVFHIPPANVDTIFVYSWLLAALTGNRNIIRMPARRTPQVEILLRLWRETLAAAAPAFRAKTIVLSYGHQLEITSALSAECDVRVIWGGDRTVSQIRQAPLPPHGRELTFPDRYSLTAIAAASYLALGDDACAALAGKFFNDAYWFDQMACSSPRLVVWCGDADTVKRSARRFWNALAAHLSRVGFDVDPAIHMRAFVFACGAVADLPVSSCRRERGITVLDLDTAAIPEGEHAGGGVFFSCRVDRLADFAPALRRKDQTLGYFGFTEAELREFVRGLGGRAIDRIVPIGQALQFSRFWDGYDLVHEFCRFTYCECPA
jgi:hypothetical protein